ncbi:MAG TPA: hypothetical protein VJZ70_03245 [Limnochordia bacterium]|nr:hypothetical protein [Limnochordia bacterium]
MKMKRIQAVIIVLAVLLVSLPVLALEPTGELSASLGAKWDSDAEKLVHTSTRTSFRLVLEDELDFGGKLHFSTKGYWDWKQKDGNLALDQLRLSGYQGDLDYQVGRQLISWGTADGFNPTNYFARMRLDSLTSGDLSGDPLWAGQATYYGPNWSVTGVVVPFFTPQEIDDSMKTLMGGDDPQIAMVLQAINATKKPRGLGKNSEWALRAETQLAGFDLQASFFSGFEPMPGLEMVLTGAVPSFEGTYRRQNFLGLAATGTVGPVGVWGEVSYGGPATFAESENPLEIARIPLSVNEKYLQAVAGGDYTFAVGNGILTQVQYIYRGQGSLIEPYVMPNMETMGPGEIKGARYLYGRLGYDFNASSSAEVLILHGFQEEAGIIRPAYTYRFPGSVQLQLSLVQIYGEQIVSSGKTQGTVSVTYQF